MRFLKFSWILFLFAIPVSADSIYIFGSYLNPNGQSDIFKQNHRETNFDVDDLNDFAITGGYDFFLGEYVVLGGSATYYQEDAIGRDRAFTDPGGGPVRRSFRLKMIPLEFNGRVLPLGRHIPVIIFIGGGVGYYFWDYEETGEFVINRDSDPTVITDSRTSDGRDFGFNLNGGIHIPFSESTYFTIEVKHIYVDGDLDRREFGRGLDPIDLSALIYSAGFTFSF